MDLEQQQRELLAQVDALAPYADIDDSARDEIQAAWAQLESLESEGPLASPEAGTTDPVLERYRQERDELRSLASPREPNQVRRFSGSRSSSSHSASPGSSASWFSGSDRATPRRSRIVSRIRWCTVDELEARVADEDRRIADADAVARAFQGQRSTHERRLGELRSQIDVALQRVKAPSAGSLEERVRAYLTASVRRGERREQEMELERVRRELEQARSPVKERDRFWRSRRLPAPAFARPTRS